MVREMVGVMVGGMVDGMVSGRFLFCLRCIVFYSDYTTFV